MCKAKRKTWGSIPSVCLTSTSLATAASKTRPSPGCPPMRQEIPTTGASPVSTLTSLHKGDVFHSFFFCFGVFWFGRWRGGFIFCFGVFLGFFFFFWGFCFTETFWVSNQLFEFPIGRLITSYWLIWRTFLPLGNGTFLSLWLLCLHTFCYLMSTLANE